MKGELRELLKKCWDAGKDYGSNRTDKNFNDFLNSVNSLPDGEAMNEEIIKVQRLIIQGYYNRIVMQQPDLDTIIGWLESDLKTIRMDNTLIEAEKIINEYDPHEASEVKCDNCSHKCVAVRPLGTDKLECPNCGNTGYFENID